MLLFERYDVVYRVKLETESKVSILRCDIPVVYKTQSRNKSELQS